MTSGSSKQWLAGQKAWVSLQTIFDDYLALAFRMDSPEHVHFGEIPEGVDREIVRTNLLQVEAQAASMCARLGTADSGRIEAAPAASPAVHGAGA